MSYPNYLSRVCAIHYQLIAITCIFVVLIAACQNESGISKISVSPEVNETVPIDNAENVFVNTTISATFSHEMNPSSINDTTFMVFRDTVPIPGTISYNDSTATFIPENNLNDNSIITARITEGVTNLEGNSMDGDYEWEFTTGETVDNSPKITETNPGRNENDVPVNTVVVATFNKPMDVSTIDAETFMLESESGNIAGEVNYSETSAVFTPSDNLETGKTYTAIVKSTVRDVDGNAMNEDYVWNFSTVENDNSDITPPEVRSTNPADNASGVAINSRIMATFTEEINATTITESTFRLSEEDRTIDGTVTYSDNTATFNPDSDLLYNTTYSATITTDVEDPAGNRLENDYRWTFTTEEDRIPPRVIETIPLKNEEGVSRNIEITATFSEAMDPSTISEETFFLRRRLYSFLISVSGSVSYDGRTATFTPESELRENSQYTAFVIDEVTDEAGNSLNNDYDWNFETGSGDDDDEEDD